MKSVIKILGSIFLFILVLGFGVSGAKARNANDVTDWYIKDFQTSITVNEDSTMDVTERITADCGNLPDKHGIFRVLPTVAKTETDTIKNPVELISITDFNGKKYKYEESKDFGSHTVTYKIGDPDKTVNGINNYEIKYRYKNVIRFANQNFDEFYWNLNGNFWEIETDHFKAEITFPSGVNKDNTQIDYYVGAFGSKDKSLASYRWDGDKLVVESTSTLNAKEGITISVAMPKGIFTPYALSEQDDLQYMDYSDYLLKYHPFAVKLINWTSLIFFLIISFISIFVWRKYGKDPKDNRSVMPEFEVPEKLAPMELGLIYSNGSLKKSQIPATVISLAVKQVIKIEEIPKKGILGAEDHKLILVNPNVEMCSSEKLILNRLFGEKKELLISELKKDLTFWMDLQDIAKTIDNELAQKNLVSLTGAKIRIGFIIAAVMIFVGGFATVVLSAVAPIGFIFSAIMLLVFGIIMPKRTVQNLDFYYKILGFRLYMDTAEKYRQRFNEKENIFEKFLPYAILFGITSKWIKKMKSVYGDKFVSYYPVWYVGGAMENFDIDHFATTISEISSSIGTASGVGGAGGAGGGGGGAGGGGW